MRTVLANPAYVLLALVALQFALQPWLFRKFTPPGVSKTSFVLLGEIVKLVLTFPATLPLLRHVQLLDSLRVAALPACLYTFQNMLNMIGYSALDGLSYAILNQTKSIFAAVFLFYVYGKKQSFQQILALTMLVCSGILINIIDCVDYKAARFSAVSAVLAASAISGLCAALTESVLKDKGRNPYLLTAELAMYSIVCIIVMEYPLIGLFDNWNLLVLIPVLSQSLGGIFIGLLVKHLGAQMKAYAIVIGIVLAGVFKAMFNESSLTHYHITALVLVVTSSIIHVKYPYKLRKDNKAKCD